MSHPAISDMFMYFGLSGGDLEAAVEQMYFWDYVVSLSESYGKFGSLTEKQYDSMLKHFDKRGYSYLPFMVVRSSLYKSKGKGRNRSAPTKVLFDNLQCVNTYDLPFESDTVVTVVLHEFNDSSVVLEFGNRFYKIPKPSHYTLGNSSYLYRRTICKGFLKSKEI